MMNQATLLLIAPVVICFGTAIVMLLMRNLRMQQVLSVLSMGLLFVVSLLLLGVVHTQGIQVAQMGGWEAPYGIVLVADHLGAIMLVASSLIGLASSIFACADIDEQRLRFHFLPLLSILMGGISGAFLAGDLFNLYVWFEVLLIASFILMALGNEPKQLAGAIKYAALNLLGSVFFLISIGLVYGMTGSLNMADLARRIPAMESTGPITVVAMMFMVAFGIKAAVFPLFFWLPASYHTPPVTVSAVFGGLLTKVGVYALVRVFTLLFIQDVAFTHTVLLWIAGLSMVIGVLGAAAQSDFRRLLSFHIISQIGYMVMGLALFTPLALLGVIFYIVHNIVVKTNLFFISGIAARLGGSFELKQLGGFYRSHPWLSILFIIPAFALAGFPPLSGFWGKFVLARAGIEVNQYTIVAVSLLVGLMTLYSMSKIWLQAFLPDRRTPPPAPPTCAALKMLFMPVILLAVTTLLISFCAAPLYVLADAAARELMNPNLYIEAVLGHE